VSGVRLDPQRCEAVVFDMDGVLTDTARVHARAWKQTFDELLERRARETGEAQAPFDADREYARYVDGVPRDDGVRRFLASRGIELAEGAPDDPPGRDTVQGVGNRKNRLFLAALRERGAAPFPHVVDCVERLRRAGLRTAVISASRNAAAVLEAAGLAGLFETRVDGVVRGELGLRGKPAPDVFLEAARRLGAAPGRTAVVEDAVAGVEAACEGGFAPVVGVARGGHGAALARAGADAVVADLSEIRVADPGAPAEGRPLRELPSALGHADAIVAAAGDRRLAVFLDYDGTLSPIVDRPEEASLPEATRAVMARLARRLPVAVVSGRDLDDLRGRVDVPGLTFAGSHGFRVGLPDGRVVDHEEARAAWPALERAATRLAEALADCPGVQVERKRFAVAVHHRRAPAGVEPQVRRAASQVADAEEGLRMTEGRKIFELRPDLDWDKGTALDWILEILGLGPDGVLPLYVGDDLTDEDAFRALEAREPAGVGILVRGRQGHTRTLAHYALSDPDEVRRFLEALETRIGPG
jgi:alpha,alpha-trehalase